MKRILLFVAFCLFTVVIYAAPTITIQNVNADEDIAAYIQGALNSKLANLNTNVTIKLTQSGDALTIDYIAGDDDTWKSENCNDIWNELDAVVDRLVSAIRPKATPAAVQPTATPTPQPSAPTATTTVTTTATIGAGPAIPSVTLPSFTMEDVAEGRVVVGGCLVFSDGTKGIIFYLDESNKHGLAVSLDCTFAQWEAVRKSRDCHDVTLLPNEGGTKALTYRVGENNTAIIINQLGAYNAPAANWCARIGEGWYLPSSGELWYLFTVANSQFGRYGLISIALQNNGGKPFTSKWYWSSTENDYDEAINVSVSGSVSSEDKVDSLPVYAVHAF